MANDILAKFAEKIRIAEQSTEDVMHSDVSNNILFDVRDAFAKYPAERAELQKMYAHLIGIREKKKVDYLFHVIELNYGSEKHRFMPYPINGPIREYIKSVDMFSVGTVHQYLIWAVDRHSMKIMVDLLGKYPKYLEKWRISFAVDGEQPPKHLTRNVDDSIITAFLEKAHKFVALQHQDSNESDISCRLRRCHGMMQENASILFSIKGKSDKLADMYQLLQCKLDCLRAAKTNYDVQRYLKHGDRVEQTDEGVAGVFYTYYYKSDKEFGKLYVEIEFCNVFAMGELRNSRFRLIRN